MADTAYNTEVFPEEENRILSSSTLLKVGERYYEVKSILPEAFSINSWSHEGINDIEVNADANVNFKLAEGVELSSDIAYLIGDYFYLYRGKLSDFSALQDLEPGIYYDDSDCKYVLCVPDTPEEIDAYKYADKITTLDADEIRNAVLNQQIIIFNIPDTVHSNIPPESKEDDILKRAMKRALLQKGIDIDQCRARFASKNMLFNFKSVLRGDNRLSMLLFERGTEALNLKYTIILEEGGGELVGRTLKEPIIISSDEVFDTSLMGMNSVPTQDSDEYDDEED